MLETIRDLVGDLSMFNRERWEVLASALLSMPREGDLYEFGTHRGGTLAAMALANPGRHCFGYDTFSQGMVGSGSYDGNYQGRDGVMAHDREAVAQLMSTHLIDNVTLVEGDVRDTLVDEPVNGIAFALVDLNIYEPTLHTLKWLAHHGTKETIILVDDVDFTGVIKALNEMKHDLGMEWEKDGYMARVWL